MRKLLVTLVLTFTASAVHAAVAVKTACIDVERPGTAMHAHCVRGHHYLFEVTPAGFPVADAEIGVASPARHLVAYSSDLHEYGFDEIEFVATTTGDWVFAAVLDDGQPGKVRLALYDMAIEHAKFGRQQRLQQQKSAAEDRKAAQIDAAQERQWKQEAAREQASEAAQDRAEHARMDAEARRKMQAEAAQERAERAQLDREEDGAPQPKDVGPSASEKQVPTPEPPTTQK